MPFELSRVDTGLLARVDAIKAPYRDRDRHAAEVRAVRKGDFDKLAPGAFNDEWPRPIVANMVNAIAQHAAAALSPLPTITCTSPNMNSDASRKVAEKRTKIAHSYYESSNVAEQRQSAADQFYTYGLMIASVEPDWTNKRPLVFYEDSIGFYPVWDRLGNTVQMVREFEMPEVQLRAKFPQVVPALESPMFGVRREPTTDRIKVAKYADADQIVMYLPDQGGAVLQQMSNPLGRCPYVATKKPGLDEEVQGQFDDIIWVQIARHFMQMLALEAAANAVEAPIVVPNDVADVPLGANAVIRTQNPAGVGRLKLDVPPAVWASIDHLRSEMQYGAISPEALGGSIDASVVTGRGVQELMAGYSQQVAMAQQTIVGHDRRVVAMCFEMDEKFWPEEQKRIIGRLEGSQYRIDYTPAKDIAGDYSADVVYGGVKGLDPNRGLVYLLQTLGGGIVSKNYVRRTVDADINPTEEEAQIALEQTRDSLMQGLSAYVQSMPALVQQGQDPSVIMANTVAVAAGLQKGEALEKVLARVFPPPEPEPEQPAETPMGPAAMEGQTGDMFAPTPGADATAGPGGRPSLQTLFAGLGSSGNPQLAAGVSRMVPAGG